MVQLKVQSKHFEVDEATWEKEATMIKDYPTLFHDIVSSPYNTRDHVVLSGEGCNTPTFGPNTYRDVPIYYDDYLNVLFYIGSNNPLHMNMMIFFIYIGHRPIIDDMCI